MTVSHSQAPSPPSPHRHIAVRPSGPRVVDRVVVDTLKAAHPLVQVAQAYGLHLIRSGPRFVTLCPLHAEAHPSCTLYPEEQRWWCYGCGRGGDVIELVRLLESVSFSEALSRLDGFIPIQYATGTYSRTDQVSPQASVDTRHDALNARSSPLGQRALAVAAATYAAELADSLLARRYLEQRGIPAPLGQRCSLGYCSGTRLVAALHRADVPLAAARRVGLLDAHTHRERLAGRITIPDLRDGNITWMTSRRVSNADGPRYLSLPGPRPLLGGALLRQYRSVILTEGVFDYLTLIGWNLPGVAALGCTLSRSALAELQATRWIYLAFDHDAPGQAAAQQLAERMGHRVRVVTLPDGIKDINDLARQPDGASRFRMALHRVATGDTELLQLSFSG